jgi:hypothetical protein
MLCIHLYLGWLGRNHLLRLAPTDLRLARSTDGGRISRAASASYRLAKSIHYSRSIAGAAHWTQD